MQSCKNFWFLRSPQSRQVMRATRQRGPTGCSAEGIGLPQTPAASKLFKSVGFQGVFVVTLATHYPYPGCVRFLPFSSEVD